MPNLPSGTVTFAFSDIEGSTVLLKQVGAEAYADLLGTHRRLFREVFTAHHGQEIDSQGDAFFYSFVRAREAVAAAVEVQRAHVRQVWPAGASVRIRLGLHTGEPVVGDEGYTGLDVVRAARIAAVGVGGQVLLSEATRAIVADGLPEGVEVLALGEQRLKDIDRPEPLYALRISGVTTSEPTIRESATDTKARTSPELPPGVPTWIRDLASPLGPVAEQTRDVIEQRVLAQISHALSAREGRFREGRKPPTPPQPPSSTRSAADEIVKLRALRDSGALTEQQYAKAVDRLLE